MSYVMAIDAGTGSCRALIFDTRGNEIGFAQREWTHRPEPGVPGSFNFDTSRNGALIDEVIAEALSKTGLSGSDIRAVSTTSMREGIVLYDKSGKELWACPNIDSRATVEADELVAEGIAARIFETGGDWVSITTPARLRWLYRHQPRIMEQVHRIGLLSDWAATRLTGEYWTEPSAGSSTALFDLRQRKWSDEMFDLLRLDRNICPPVVESGSVIGSVTRAAAQRTGLKEGTPVVAGGGDTQLGLLGLGRKVNDGTLVGGSFWQMTILLDRPFVDPGRGPRTLCHAVPGQWMVEGIGFLSGLALRWFRDTFCQGEVELARAEGASAFERLNRMAAEVPPGSHGVLAIIASVMQSDSWIQPATGLLGFNLGNAEIDGKAVALRAIMESAAYVSLSHRTALEALTGVEFSSIQFTGGGARGRLWPQIIADVMGIPVSIPRNIETTALGCAMLAAAGAGLHDGIESAVAAMASPTEYTVEPDMKRHELYLELHARWKKVTDAMVSLADAGITEPAWRPAGALRRNVKA